MCRADESARHISTQVSGLLTIDQVSCQLAAFHMSPLFDGL